MKQTQTIPLAPDLPAMPTINLDSEDSQMNVRVAKNLKNVFIAACEQKNISATEALTRLMLSFVEDTFTRRPRHMDGSVCPLAEFTASLSTTVLQLAARELGTTNERRTK